MFRFRLEGQGKLSENLEVSQGKGLLEAEERACEKALSQEKHNKWELLRHWLLGASYASESSFQICISIQNWELKFPCI